MESLPKELNQEAARRDLEEIQMVFDKFNVPLFLTYGALLGIVRDKNFIPYDDDIDLCITAKIDYKTRKQIGWMLQDLGYGPQPIAFRLYGRMEPAMPGYNGDEHSGIIVCQKRIRTTLFFFGEEDCPIHGKDMVCHPLYKGARIISTPSHFFENPGTLKFKGKKYLTPNPVKEYLSFVYGEDWKKPIKGKHAVQWEEMHPEQENE
jgi:hypothetical protein